jgi:hypothetical protein
MIRLRRWFFYWLEIVIDRLSYWQCEHDLCEICKRYTADRICIGCNRRIDYECDSCYYNDENLCIECRKDITPEQEAEDARLAAEYPIVD